MAGSEHPGELGGWLTCWCQWAAWGWCVKWFSRTRLQWHAEISLSHEVTGKDKHFQYQKKSTGPVHYQIRASATRIVPFENWPKYGHITEFQRLVFPGPNRVHRRIQISFSDDIFKPVISRSWLSSLLLVLS